MTNIKPMGGTELMLNRLLTSVDQKYWKKIQLIVSKINPSKFDPNKKKIVWLHDTTAESHYPALFCNSNFINSIDRFVFVSHWQYQDFLGHFRLLPAEKCSVIKNAIEPIEVPVNKRYNNKKPKLIYTSTPHRGLTLFYGIVDKLHKEGYEFSADIYSSFNIYGWTEAQKSNELFFDKLSKHPRINYYGTKSNSEVREA